MSAAGIRLAASVATCVLVVMIILFVMHRFRRNRLLLNIRHGKLAPKFYKLVELLVKHLLFYKICHGAFCNGAIKYIDGC